MESQEIEDNSQMPELLSETNTCVIRTLESLASIIAKKKVKVDAEGITVRKQQLDAIAEQTAKLIDVPEEKKSAREYFSNIHRARQRAKRYGPVLLRQEQENIKALVEFIKNNPVNEVGSVLKACKISFEPGGLTHAKRLIEEGFEVGVITQINTGMFTYTHHIFHLNADATGNLQNMSDDAEPIKLDEGMTYQIDQYMWKIHELTADLVEERSKAWTILAIKA